MNTTHQKKLALLSLLLLLTVGAIAQQNHFIYLQTEHKNPFYVKMDNSVWSSSVSGYLIIPKLQEGTYNFSIGFPKDEWPEQKVTCTVKKDAGYLLKNFGAKGWGLFNLQTMEVQMLAATVIEKTAVLPEDTRQDIFSTTLSGVVNDPSIIIKSEEEKALAKQDSAAAAKEENLAAAEVTKPVTKEEIKIPVPEENTTAIVDTKPAKAAAKQEVHPLIELIKKEEPAAVDNKIAVTEKKAAKTDTRQEAHPLIEVIKKEEPLVRDQKVTKLFSFTSTGGTDIVYVDIVNGIPDTIRLFIPADKNHDVAKLEKKPAEQPIMKEEKQEIKKDNIQTAPAKTEVIKKEAAAMPAKEAPGTEAVKAVAIPKTVVIKKEKTKKEPVNPKSTNTKFIDIELMNPNTVKKDTSIQPAFVEKKAVPVKEEQKTIATGSKPLIYNSDCKSLANEDDFIKIRKKMAAADNDDDMIAVARKTFKSKCFTTEQVKNLSILFVKDEGRYKFFDAAYPFVSDAYNFDSLESQLTDTYFITRFKAMIHH